VIVTNAAVVVAVQLQPDPAVTVTVPVPPAAAKLVVTAEAVTVHDGDVGVVVPELLLLEQAAAPNHRNATGSSSVTERLRIDITSRA
jgi:hypothetical protein